MYWSIYALLICLPCLNSLDLDLHTSSGAYVKPLASQSCIVLGIKEQQIPGQTYSRRVKDVVGCSFLLILL